MIAFTQSQIKLMSDEDRADVEKAEKQGFKKPCYIRLTQNVRGEIVAYEQPFSPVALRIVSNGKRYPDNATRENCEKLIAIWNAGGKSRYSIV